MEVVTTCNNDRNSNSKTPFFTLALLTSNFGANPADVDKHLERLATLQPDKPLFVTEFWTGWFDHWFVPFKSDRSLESFSTSLEKVLPPFQKSRNASPQSTVTRSLGSFLRMMRRHLQETDELNQAFLIFWNGGSNFFAKG